MNQFSKNQLATIIAIIFHTIGLLGILFFDKEFFIRSTVFNLLLMFLLILFTQVKQNRSFIFFIIVCFITGIITEMIGVNTGWLFGSYNYGNVLGPKVLEVPLIIGINWFIIIYCCGITVQVLLTKVIDQLYLQSGKPVPSIKLASIIVDGATLAVLFDWLMEPVAIKLGYWTWIHSDEVPLFNYICWFGISCLLMTAFHFSSFNKENKFAVNLLLIQAMFFLLLRSFL
ncbi:MAG: carotenoid biosynthesis protein [Ferruginibacter sp.]